MIGAALLSLLVLAPQDAPSESAEAQAPQQGPSRAELTAIARELAEGTGIDAAIETRPLASGNGLAVALRVGDADGGHALVLGDFTAPSARGLTGRTREAACLARAILAGDAGTRVRREGSGLVLLLGATAPEPAAGAGTALFDRNFPVSSWGDARRLDPAGAGPYPCSRADVAATVDWMVGEHGCYGVLDLRTAATEARGGPPAGSLAAFCRTEARVPRAAATVRPASGRTDGDALRGPVRALGSLLDARTRVSIEGTSVRRVGATDWIVELTVAVNGSRAARPAALSVRLAAGEAWVGAAQGGVDGGSFETLRLHDGTGTLTPIRPGERRVLRVFVHAEEARDGGAAPPLEVTLAAPRCRTHSASVELVEIERDAR